MSGRIIHGDAETAIPHVPVQLVVTSPPYNVGIDYGLHHDLMSHDDWFMMVDTVLTEAWDRLVTGGRMAVNIQHSYGRKPLMPLGREIEEMLIDMPDSLYRGCIIWDKGAAAGSGSAWGSWRTPSNPVLRGEHEMIYVFSKEQYDLSPPPELVERYFPLRIPDEITEKEFHAATIEVWREWDGRLTTNQKTTGHPAAFPVSLARRLIQLYSWEGNTVLDPFFGSGTTGNAAESLNRNWIGVEISREYCELAARTCSMIEDVEVPIESV
jgi:site-specific DNA-methyltransferase (adenine-specific)